MDAEPSRPSPTNARRAYYDIKTSPCIIFKSCFEAVKVDLTREGSEKASAERGRTVVANKSELSGSCASTAHVQYPCGSLLVRGSEITMKCDLCGSSELRRGTASVSSGRERRRRETGRRRRRRDRRRRIKSPVQLHLERSSLKSGHSSLLAHRFG